MIEVGTPDAGQPVVAKEPKVFGQSPIRWSPEIGEIAQALVAAQAKMEPLRPDATNNHLSKDYSSTGAVLKACLAAYHGAGIAVLQFTTMTGELVRITTRLQHESAEWLEFDLDMRPENQTAQKIGTAATYGRRYSLLGVSALAPLEEGPDAAEAQQKAKQTGKRLTKAQADDLYKKMQTGLRNQRSVKGVNNWLANFADQLAILPEDFERELRKEAQQEIEGHESNGEQGAGF